LHRYGILALLDEKYIMNRFGYEEENQQDENDERPGRDIEKIGQEEAGNTACKS